MKKVYVLTWDTEYEGLLHSYKAYPTKEAAEKKIYNIKKAVNHHCTERKENL